jgi:two-component system response regulator HydG
VRELQNAVRHGAALATGGEVQSVDLPDEIREPLAARGGELVSLAEAERRHILSVLDACGGSQVEAAEVLGIGRNTLWRKLRRYSSCNANVV